MTRDDLPYVALVTIFACAIFWAGRLSAPVTATVLPAPPVAPIAIPTAPQVIVIASSLPEPPAPPVEVEVVKPTPSMAAAPKAPKPVVQAPEFKPVPPIKVELEEDPVPSSSQPGF